MKIKACKIWTPKDDASIKGVVYEYNRYVVTTDSKVSAIPPNVCVKGIELSPASEIVIMLHSDDVRVYGYCPYALELEAEEAKE